MRKVWSAHGSPVSFFSIVILFYFPLWDILGDESPVLEDILASLPSLLCPSLTQWLVPRLLTEFQLWDPDASGLRRPVSFGEWCLMFTLKMWESCWKEEISAHASQAMLEQNVISCWVSTEMLSLKLPTLSCLLAELVVQGSGCISLVQGDGCSLLLLLTECLNWTDQKPGLMYFTWALACASLNPFFK